MTAEELAAHVEAIGPVVEAIADELADELPLTDEEAEALGIADTAIRIGRFACDVSGNPYAAAASALLAAVPIVQLVRLIESWRSVTVTAEEGGVIIGPLGPGVVVEGRG